VRISHLNCIRASILSCLFLDLAEFDQEPEAQGQMLVEIFEPAQGFNHSQHRGPRQQKGLGSRDQSKASLQSLASKLNQMSL